MTLLMSEEIFYLFERDLHELFDGKETFDERFPVVDHSTLIVRRQSDDSIVDVHQSFIEHFQIILQTNQAMKLGSREIRIRRRLVDGFQ